MLGQDVWTNIYCCDGAAGDSRGKSALASMDLIADMFIRSQINLDYRTVLVVS